jgi:hypothetical protein
MNAVKVVGNFFHDVGDFHRTLEERLSLFRFLQ